MRRTFVVGDVHGCLTELEQLLVTAGVTANDQLVMVGDLVAKGPDSAGVVALLREKGALGVRGNHDAHVLKHRDGEHLKKHHREVAKALSDADWRYLERLPLYLELDEHDVTVVHAGVPGVPLAEQEPSLLLNMRSVDAQGQPSKRVEGGVPWASKWKGPRFVIFGHDAVRGLQQHPFALGLDTGCVYGGRLTGVWLPERQLVSVPAVRVWHAPGDDR